MPPVLYNQSPFSPFPLCKQVWPFNCITAKVQRPVSESWHQWNSKQSRYIKKSQPLFVRSPLHQHRQSHEQTSKSADVKYHNTNLHYALWESLLSACTALLSPTQAPGVMLPTPETSTRGPSSSESPWRADTLHIIRPPYQHFQGQNLWHRVQESAILINSPGARKVWEISLTEGLCLVLSPLWIEDNILIILNSLLSHLPPMVRYPGSRPFFYSPWRKRWGRLPQKGRRCDRGEG